MPHNQNQGVFPSPKMLFSILFCETLENVPARKLVMDVAQAHVKAP